MVSQCAHLPFANLPMCHFPIFAFDHSNNLHPFCTHFAPILHRFAPFCTVLHHFAPVLHRFAPFCPFCPFCKAPVVSG